MKVLYNMSPDHECSTPVVLVVEDEIVLRMKAVDIVEDAGFTPVEAANADQAIAILESRSDISVLFTDIQMPGTMDGLKLAHAVHLRWPTIKIILVSGQITVTDAEKPAQSRFFGKPLEMDHMIAELRTMVGNGALEIVPDVLAQGGLATGYDSLHQADQLKRDALTAENDSLRLSLEQAGIDAKRLLVQAGIEAKEREAAGKLQTLIHEELHHRIKNTLATVSAIATQSLRTATSLNHCQRAIEGRLAALGRAHDMLMRVSWANASLAQTIRSATEPYDSKEGGRFTINGPDVRITSGAVIAFAMTLNELCTNTTKFGALSVPTGSVDVYWSIDEELQRLQLRWVEKGGPTISEPSRRSFGTRMMASLGQQLNGEVQLDYDPDGFNYSLDVPLATLTAKADAR